MKRVVIALMLLVFALGAACGSAATTDTTTGATPATVMGIESHPLPHNIPYE